LCRKDRKKEILSYAYSVNTFLEWGRLGLLAVYTNWKDLKPYFYDRNEYDEAKSQTVDLVMLLTFISWFTLLSYLRWFKNFRVFFELLFASFSSIGAFMIVLIVMFLSFTSAFWNINRKDPRLLGPDYCGAESY
jgi:magnesium-transporting ATPase (P-type)